MVSILNLDLVLTGGPVASSVGSSGLVVHPTLSDLRSIIDPSGARLYQTLGYSAISDGGDARYYWDATSNAQHNGGSIISLTGVASGRMKLLAYNYVNIKQFGAKGDNLTNCLGAFRTAVDFLASGGTIGIPAGTYSVVQSGFSSGTLNSYFITPRSNTRFVGESGSVINIQTTKIPTFVCSHTSGNVFQNLDFIWSGNRVDEGSPDDLSPSWTWADMKSALGVVTSGWQQNWNHNTSWPAVFGFGCDYLTIDRCTFTSANLASGMVMPVWIHLMGKAASGLYGVNNRVTNCRFNGYLWGLHLSNQDGLFVSDILVTNNDQHPSPNGHIGEFIYMSTPSDTGYSRWSKNCTFQNIVDTGVSLAQYAGLHATLKFRLLQDSTIQNISSAHAGGGLDLIGIRRCYFANLYFNLQNATETNYASEGAIRIYQPQEDSIDGLASALYSEKNVLDGVVIHGPNTLGYSNFRLFQSDQRNRYNVYKNWVIYADNSNDVSYLGCSDSSFDGTFIISNASSSINFAPVVVPPHATGSRIKLTIKGTDVARVSIQAASGFVNNQVTVEPWLNASTSPGPRLHSSFGSTTSFGSRAMLEPVFGADPQVSYTGGTSTARTGNFQLPYQGIWLLSCTATQNASPSAKATQQFQVAWLDSRATVQSLGSLMALTASSDISSISATVSTGGVMSFTVNQNTGQTSNTVDVGYLWTSQLWSANP